MDAKKCDRCGNFYNTPSVFRKYSILLTVGYSKRALDLCPECYDILASFLKNEQQIIQYNNSVKEDPLK